MNILRPDSLSFPDHRAANREGLLALGGDLSVPRLLLAYRSGIFPWTDDPLTWWSPDPRAIFEIDSFHPPKRLAAKLRQKPFEVTMDRDFSSVIRACAQPAPGRESTWISPRFVEAYTELHRQGHATASKSGGTSSWSAACMAWPSRGFSPGNRCFIARRTRRRSRCAISWTICGQKNSSCSTPRSLSPLTARLGAIEIRRRDYLERLTLALRNPARF